jgi:hypothetical protein
MPVLDPAARTARARLAAKPATTAPTLISPARKQSLSVHVSTGSSMRASPPHPERPPIRLTGCGVFSVTSRRGGPAPMEAHRDDR